MLPSDQLHLKQCQKNIVRNRCLVTFERGLVRKTNNITYGGLKSHARYSVQGRAMAKGYSAGKYCDIYMGKEQYSILMVERATFILSCP